MPDLDTFSNGDANSAVRTKLNAAITQTNTNTTNVLKVLSGAVINAMDPAYGAVGDGVADDTTALQAALDAGKAANAGVFIPAGVYKITSALTVTPSYDGTLIYGEGEYRSRIVSTSTTAHGIAIDTSGSLKDGFTIKNLSIYGAGDGVAAGHGIDIVQSAESLERFRLEGVKIQGWDIGVLARQTSQSTITGCWIGLNRIGIEFSLGCLANTIIGCGVNINSVANIYLSACNGMSIISCDLGGSAPQFIQVRESCKTVNIQGCNFEVPAATTLYAIKFDAYAGFDEGTAYSVRNCNFLGSPSTVSTFVPIRCTGGTRLHVEGNVMHSFPSAMPLVFHPGRCNVTGSPAYNYEAQTDASGMILEGSTDYYQPGPFPLRAQVDSLLVNQYTRMGISWQKSSGTSTNDDLVAVYENGGGGGGKTYHKTSLLNAHIIAPLEAWAAAYPITNGVSSTAHVAEAIEELQTAINGLSI